MKGRIIFDALSEVNEKYLHEALTTKIVKQSSNWKKWSAIAACIVVVIGVVALLQQGILPIGGNGTGNIQDGAGGDGAPGVGSVREAGDALMLYGGPVFPLGMDGEDDTLSADRSISFDFSSAFVDLLADAGAKIDDSYSLTNSSSESKTVNLIYPFTGNFYELDRVKPVVSVGGKIIEPTLNVGSFTGKFIGEGGSDPSGGTYNIQSINSWEELKSFIYDGSYKANALAPAPELSQTVAVYTFSDFIAPEGYDAATQEIDFQIDNSRTKILTFGFEGTKIDDNGNVGFNFFVPRENQTNRMIKKLIVVGDDITDYELKGFKNGDVSPENSLDGVSSTITRTEMVLSDVVYGLIDDYFNLRGEPLPEGFPKELYFNAVSDILLNHSLISENAKDRYETGSLFEVFEDVFWMKRIFYLEFEVQIPANDALQIDFSLLKYPSQDPPGLGTNTGIDNVTLQGYEMATRLGSTLKYNTLTAELVPTGKFEIVGQNFGFDILNNITKVELDLSADRYYIEIKAN